MRRHFAYLFTAALLWSLPVVAAGDRAAELLKSLSAAMESMPSYTVRFTVEAGGSSIDGTYSVDGSRYRIFVAGNEVYGDESVRVEVDASKKEIVIDNADTSSRNLLSNPVGAFSFLGEEYGAHLDSEEGGRAVLTLSPRNGSAGVIVVTLATASSLPQRVVYDTDGDRVEIVIGSISRGAEVKTFDESLYEGFEVIDFR